MSADKTQAESCYRLTGNPESQPVVVLVHGVGLRKEMWNNWIPVLSRDFCVLTYDLLGHGGSGNPPGERSATVFCDQLQHLLDALGIQTFSLVGFSIGAVIAQAFAALYQERLNHVVFLHGVYKRTEEQCAAVRERYAITRDQGPMATVELAIKRWYSPAYIDANPQRMDELRRVFSEHTDDGYLKAYRFFCYAEEEMRQFDMSGVKVSSLVLTGGAERGSTPAMSEALAADLPNATLIINPGHLHMAPDEHSDLLAKQVLSFLLENSIHTRT